MMCNLLGTVWLLCCTLLYCTLLCCTLLYCTLLCCTLLCCTLLCCTLLCCTLLCCTLLCCTLLYCTLLCCTLLCCTLLYCTLLCCTLLCCTLLYCTLLCCTLLCCTLLCCPLLYCTLLCCTLSLGVVQAARTMQTRTRPRDSFIQVGSLLKLATWNCGGLSFMQREMCRDLDYDLLALTETHDKGTLQRKKDFICCDIAPQNDPFSGVALLLSNRLSKCVLHNGSNSSRVVFA